MQKLKHLVLNITENCNLRCDYCFLKNKKNNKMSIQEAEKAIDFLIQENIKNEDELSMTFFGGEPLLVFPEVKEIVDYVRLQEKKMAQSLNEGGIIIEGVIERNNGESGYLILQEKEGRLKQINFLPYRVRDEK